MKDVREKLWRQIEYSRILGAVNLERTSQALLVALDALDYLKGESKPVNDEVYEAEEKINRIFEDG